MTAARNTPLQRAVDGVWNPTPAGARRTAAAVVVVLMLVVVTGAVVRLTGSGLGCPTWPTCHGDSVASGFTLHGAIEFGNRVISVGVFLTGIVLLGVQVLRLRRTDLLPLLSALFAGYLAEAVLGGLTVLTRLNPLLVGLHFLLAIALLWAAVLIWRRVAAPAVAPLPVVGPELRWLGRGLVAGAGAILVLGTLVTGTGPHAGSRVDNRLPFDLRDITQLHSDLVLFLIGATVVTMLALRMTDAPMLLRRRARTLLLVMLAQSAVGFVQYATGLPAWLVGVHVAGATVFWVCCLQLTLDMWTRPVPAGERLTARELTAVG